MIKGYRIRHKVREPEATEAKSEGDPSTHEDACEGGEEPTDQGRRQRDRMDAKGRVVGGRAKSMVLGRISCRQLNADVPRSTSRSARRSTSRNASGVSSRDGIL